MKHIKGTIGGIPIDLYISEEIVQVQEPLFTTDIPPKKKRGRPRKLVNHITDKPKTDAMIYTLKHDLYYMDDQIEKMTFNEAWKKIGEYKQTLGK